MEEIKFINADSRGIIEYGFIDLELKTDIITILLEQHDTGDVFYFLENLEYKSKLESIGVEFNDNEIIGPSEFINELYQFYDYKSK